MNVAVDLACLQAMAGSSPGSAMAPTNCIDPGIGPTSLNY
jgi:hypothetical protein